MTFLALACAIIVVPFIFGSMIFGMERTLWAYDDAGSWCWVRCGGSVGSWEKWAPVIFIALTVATLAVILA